MQGISYEYHLIYTNKQCYTGRFIMFSVITNIYNKKTKGPTLMEFFTATGKQKKFFFWQLEMFDVCTMDDTAHIDTIFKLYAFFWVFPRRLEFICHINSRRQGITQKKANDIQNTAKAWNQGYSSCWHVCGKNLNIVSMCALSPMVHTSNISSCQKKLFQFFCGSEKFH